MWLLPHRGREGVERGANSEDSALSACWRQKHRKISLLLRPSRHAVQKVMRSEATTHPYQGDIQLMPGLGDYRVRLIALFEEDWQRPKKRRSTSQ